jgi:Nif-specific regulatory protein
VQQVHKIIDTARATTYAPGVTQPTLVRPARRPPSSAAVGALLEVSQALSGAPTLTAGLNRVLSVLGESCGAVRSAITLIDPASGHLYIEASAGITAEGRRARYRLGEGITGRVVEHGKPIIVPQVSREPLFLYRAASRREVDTLEVSFLCVPLAIGSHTIGALSADFPYEPARDYEALSLVLSVVAAQIAQALKIQRLLDAERARLLEENEHLRHELQDKFGFDHIIGSGGAMRGVCEQIAQVAGMNTTVLVRGESGTGKELIAHALHYTSPRAKGPFIRVSCAALPDTLIESELFGHERGAFTGAHARKKGRFELAEGGTLFLDEVGELNLTTQVKLLRVLQAREFERVGGTETLRANVRLVAATNTDLEQAITAGAFRDDLYYRLNVFTIFVPPLRERKPDVLLLADHFVEKYAREHGKSIRRISTPCIDMLMSYHWPGNVRELENTIERAVVVCDGSVIHAHHLPPTLQTAEATGTGSARPFLAAVAAYEKDLILDALKTARGNRAKAARLLETTERIVRYKIRKYGIDPARFRG